MLSAPLIVASALAACTQRVKIGIAVQVLPLSNPLRLAEISYDEVLGEYAVFGTRPRRSLTGCSRSGKRWERVLKSMRLFAERVAPRLA